jgi:hypothetical protein
MCSFSRPSIPAPEPAPIPPAPPVVAKSTTANDAPKMAESTSSVETSTAQRKKRGRGSLRIPLTSSGLSGSGVNFPTT